jgi:serine/threonine protein kinase
MEIDDDCLSVASTQTGEPSPLSAFSLTPQSQPCSSSHRHISISHEFKSPCEGAVVRGELRLKNLVKVREVGRGSSGVVYRVQDRQSNRVWALKEVPLQADEEKRRMTIDELRTAYGINHAHIVSCHEVFYSQGVFSLVMDYMDGGSLLDSLKAAGGRLMPLDALAHVGRSISLALMYLHEDVAVVHRDVKPGNILLSSSGEVKLADLGICTRPGELQALSSAVDGEPAPATAWVGTVTYMSPERLTGSGYSFSADVWSLGIVLAEAAVGRYPYALSPAMRSAGAGAEARTLQFWDLLDMVVEGPCPSRLVAEECLLRAHPAVAQVQLRNLCVARKGGCCCAREQRRH